MKSPGLRVGLGLSFLISSVMGCLHSTSTALRPCSGPQGIPQKHYEAIFYGSANFNSPNTIINLDNNEELLELARGGNSKVYKERTSFMNFIDRAVLILRAMKGPS